MLQDLAIATNNKVTLLRDGAHVAVMAVAREHESDLEAIARNNRVPLVRDGAQAARTHSNVEVSQALCSALAFLASSADNRVPLLHAGAHMAVMAAAQVHADDAEVARDARDALFNLVSASLGY